MSTTRFGARRAPLAAPLTAAVLLAGCAAATGTASEPPTAGTWTGTEDGAQACVVASTAEGWEAVGERMQDWTNSVNEWSYCRLVDFSTGEDPVDVQFLPGDAYDSLEGVVERDGVKVIESGGRIVEAWILAGGPRYEDDFLTATIGVRQTTGRFADEELLAFLTAAAIEHENHDWRWFKRDGLFLEELAGDAAGDAAGDSDALRLETGYDSALRAGRQATTAVAASALASVVPAAATGGDGNRWPDGDYSVSVSTRAAGSGSTGEGSGTAGWVATGDFALGIVDGAGRAPYTIAYTFSGAGTSTEGREGSAELSLTITGEAIAEGGFVRMERTGGTLIGLAVSDGGQFGSADLSVPIAASGTDPLTATGSSCGILSGTWTGITEGLAAAVELMPGDARVAFSELRSTFLAGAAGLGDFGLWAEERAALLDEVYDLAFAVGTMRSAELDEAARQAYALVQRGERLRNELRTDYCPGYATGEIGMTQAMVDLLFAVLGNPVTSPQALGDFLAAAMRAGALPTGDAAIDRALLDRMVELESVTVNPVTRIQMATAAGALGYEELSDRLLHPEDYYPGEGE